METAKLSQKGQVTIPKDIRDKLNLKKGDKVLFFEDEEGQVIIANASQVALIEIQRSMRGEAERAGIENEEEANALAKRIRSRLWEEDNAGND